VGFSPAGLGLGRADRRNGSPADRDGSSRGGHAPRRVRPGM